MPILYSSEKKLFTLHTAHTTYQFQIDPYGVPLHLYYGTRCEGEMDYLLRYADRGFSGNPYAAGDDRTYSYDTLPQEYPVWGSGDYRSTLLSLRDERGTLGCAPRYRSHEIRPGKYALSGLPAVYAAEEEAESLSLELVDERLGLSLTLLYGVLPECDIITRSVIVKNRGTQTFRLGRLQSACLDFVGGDFDLITFPGRYALERQADRRPLGRGTLSVGSRRGYSSHQYNPLVFLCDRETTESTGRCWAMQLVWSGGFLCEAERDQLSQTRLALGMDEVQMDYPLAPGESITAPEVILSYSASGLEKLSHHLHRCLNRHVRRGKYRDARTPILLNSWEASYFDFTGESLLALAKKAKDLGVEMLVMDDGWFGARRDDKSSLGDWTVNEKKLGMPLKELAARVNAMGLAFGIWMEPEMISEDSELFRAHSDWALTIPGQAPVRSRSQLVLDFSRAEVREHVFASICAVLDSANIEYLKWDLNRSIADVYSHAAPCQGRVLYQNMLGVYEMLEKLCARYPDLLIEGCSGGGGRFDAGMLYYCPQIWCSDNTDAIDRLVIQHGSSFGYPAAAVGAHVSICPNHQTGRTVPLSTRGIVAAAGTFGYELDPAQLTKAECEEVRRQIRAYCEDAPLVRGGLYYRLSDPAKDAWCAWSFVSEDGSSALLGAVLREKHANAPAQYLRLRGLVPGARYRARETGKIYPADALTDAGLPLPLDCAEYGGFTLHLERE